jgi:hypothetical protein
MKQLAYPKNKGSPYIIILIAFGLYVAFFALNHDHMGSGVAALATIPVIGASWYFGVKGGLLTATLLILSNLTILFTGSHSHVGFFLNPGNLIGTFSLLRVSLIVGTLGKTSRERREAILKLEAYEFARRLIPTS